MSIFGVPKTAPQRHVGVAIPWKCSLGVQLLSQTKEPIFGDSDVLGCRSGHNKPTHSVAAEEVRHVMRTTASCEEGAVPDVRASDAK